MREPPLGLEVVPAPGSGALLRRDPRRADDRGAARRALREGAAGAGRGAARHIGRHQSAGRRPVGPRAAASRGSSSPTCSLRRSSAIAAWSTTQHATAMQPLAGSCSTTASPPPAGSTAPASRRAGTSTRGTRQSPTSTTRSRGATSASRTRTTWASTPRRSSTTRHAGRSAKTLMMFYKRLREIDVPEMMASIIHRDAGQAVGLLPRHDAPALGRGPPRDDGRGRLRRARRRLDRRRAINHNWSLRPQHASCTPMERHAVLYFIEQGLMTKTGKRYEWEVGVRVGHPADGALSRTTTGPTRCCTPRSAGEWYVPQFGALEGGARLRRPLLVEDPDATGRRCATRA